MSSTVPSAPCAIALFLAATFAVPPARSEPAAQPELPAGYVEEAPLPEGFPPPSEPGKVVEKTYPVIRSFSSTGPGAFMKCFAYLSLKQHKMTAPVVMECKSDADPTKTPIIRETPVPIERMHFLLEKNSLDKPQEAGPVKVDDMPALRVLSLAFQGETSPAAIKQGQAEIEAQLKKMPTVRRAGEYRILGYNSPMLARSKNFWELQLPIEDAPAKP